MLTDILGDSFNMDFLNGILPYAPYVACALITVFIVTSIDKTAKKFIDKK